MANRNNVLTDIEDRIFYLSDNIETSTISQINFQLIKESNDWIKIKKI